MAAHSRVRRIKAIPDRTFTSEVAHTLDPFMDLDDGRPRSAQYVPRQCREHRPGAGGSPLPPSRLRQRPSSAHDWQLGAKTERWREAGKMRWPPRAEAKRREVLSDAVPFRQSTEYNQGHWQNELWLRSLRKPGLLLQDPVYASPGGELQEMNEEWRGCPPVSPRSVPFCGATASGRAALPNEKVPERWVERPVATGKYALTHMDGGRYKFDAKNPRFHDDEAHPQYGGSSGQAHATRHPGSTRRSPKGTVSPHPRWGALLCQN